MTEPAASRPIKVRIAPMTPGIPTAARVRGYFAIAAITCGLAGVAWRAWSVQVDDNGHYRVLASKQHALTLDIPAPRGEVIDAHGRALAISADADSVWANPHEIRDVTATAERLAPLLDVEPATLEAKLATDRRFVWLARHVAPEVAVAVHLAKVAGIEVSREPRRWYPVRELAGTVIGRADIDGNGLDGVELAMNEPLTGARGTGSAVRDARGRRMFDEGFAQPEPGATVKLTLDLSVQAIAETALAEAIAANAAHSGVVVVLDVATSRVLAMASFPTYDPNHARVPTRNRAVTDVFEAGSIMKVFSVASALDAGAVTPDSEFDVQRGLLMIGSKAIRDTHFDTFLTVGGIIKRSSNVGAVKVAQRLGKDKLHDGLVRFGFGAKSEIELPGEQTGTLRAASRWRDIEFATIAFGYGLTVTPLQIAAALAAVGNDGVYHAPRIVEEVVDRAGHPIARAASDSHRAITSRAASEMRAMLASVFEGGKLAGTAAGVVVPGFRCGGKTGTAHKYDPALRGYSEDRYLASFIGLAPIANPRLAIVVIIDEPTGDEHFGGKVAGPVFAKVASDSLRYLGVPGEATVCASRAPPGITPPTSSAKTCVAAPSPALQPVRAELPDLAQPEPEPEPEQAPEAGARIPDFRGMGMRRALDTARDHSIAVDVAGSGHVIEQDPAPGSRSAGARVALRFSDGDSLGGPRVPPRP